MSEEYKYDVSLCVPFAGGLWESAIQTLNHLAMVLTESRLTHEIIVVANNTPQQNIDNIAKLVAASGFGPYHHSRIIVNDIPSNGLAANKAAEKSSGRYLCFTDAHVVVSSNIFTELIRAMNMNDKVGMVHAPITWTGFPHTVDFRAIPNSRCYQYRYREWDKKKHAGQWYLDQHFHGTYSHFNDGMMNPRKIAGCGHGFFMMKNDVWKKVGGYHPAQRSYGGREPFLTFKNWMFGYENYTVPAVHHIHSNLPRGYEWTDETNTKFGMDVWYRNCLQSAYCIGGDKWLDKIYGKFSAKKGVKPKVIQEIRDKAVADSKVQRQFVLDNKIIEFDDLWPMFDKQGIFY